MNDDNIYLYDKDSDMVTKIYDNGKIIKPLYDYANLNNSSISYETNNIINKYSNKADSIIILKKIKKSELINFIDQFYNELEGIKSKEIYSELLKYLNEGLFYRNDLGSKFKDMQLAIKYDEALWSFINKKILKIFMSKIGISEKTKVLG